MEELVLLIQQVYCILKGETTCFCWSRISAGCNKHFSLVSLDLGSKPLMETKPVDKKYSIF